MTEDFRRLQKEELSKLQFELKFAQAQLLGERKNIAGWIAARDANLKRAERAEQQLDEALAGCRETNARAEAAEAEVTRLRAALVQFNNHFGPLADNEMLHPEARKCFRLARAALESKT